jgi:lambda family phage portal protein
MREVARRMNIQPPNIWEKAISRVAPSLARSIYRTRCAFSAVESYSGASKSRRSLSRWNPPNADFDTDVLPDLPDLRDRSEDLFRNNMIAGSGINVETTSVIGSGLTAQPRIDSEFLGLTDDQADEWESITAREWLHYSESKFCTVNCRHNFREFQNLAFMSSLIRGDSFVITPELNPTSYFPYRLRLQLIEADRICNENNQADNLNLSGGIETDDNGRPLFLHISKRYPGSIRAGWVQQWEKVRWFGESTGRRNVLQIYRTIRADQSRGVPVLAPVMEGLKQFGTLTQATIDAAVVQTLLAVFIETPDGGGLNLAEGDTSKVDSESVKLETAAIIDLAAGEKATVVTPTHPNDKYGEFAREFFTQVGMALQIPHEVLTKFFQSSYTAAQGALLEAWRYFLMRRQFAKDNLCQPVYELFLMDAIGSGRIKAPGFFTDPLVRAAYCGADWVGAPRGHIREDVQNQADADAEDRGWKTSEQNTQERGGRWDRNLRQRTKEIQQKKDAGLIQEVVTPKPIKEIVNEK